MPKMNISTLLRFFLQFLNDLFLLFRKLLEKWKNMSNKLPTTYNLLCCVLKSSEPPTQKTAYT